MRRRTRRAGYDNNQMFRPPSSTFRRMKITSLNEIELSNFCKDWEVEMFIDKGVLAISSIGFKSLCLINNNLQGLHIYAFR
jgi:hypothetical protein